MGYRGRSRSGYGSQHHRKSKKKWFKAEGGKLYGWSKTLSEVARHRAINRSIKNKGLLRTWDSLHGLSNVSQDAETARKAAEDRDWMSKEYAAGLEKARKQTR